MASAQPVNPSPARHLLRNQRDWQSIVYLLFLPVLVAVQWLYGFSWPGYLAVLFLTLGIGVIHHNHTHVRMWRSRRLNRITDLWITALQGHPTFVFYPAHIANHHRYRHGKKDIARTYRFGGDSNDLGGYLLHPVQAAFVLYPLFASWLTRLYRYQRGVFYYCVMQYLVVFTLCGSLALIDWKKWLVLVLIPQLHGLHWLLATNYLQHAHADGNSTGFNYARNFGGWVNPLLFNIGLHTAHHENPRLHWSQLNDLHLIYQDKVDSRLQEKSLAGYMIRVYLLGLLHPRWRSRSLMKQSTIKD